MSKYFNSAFAAEVINVAICNSCEKKISRGKAELPPGKMSNHGMDSHLKTHKEEYKAFQEAKQAAKGEKDKVKVDQRDESSSGSGKQGLLTSHTSRQQFLNKVSNLYQNLAKI